jgi:hypothetical protein
MTETTDRPASDGGGQGGRDTAVGGPSDSDSRVSLIDFVKDLQKTMGDVIDGAYGDLLPEELLDDYRTVFEGLSGQFDLVLAQLMSQPGLDGYLHVADLMGAANRLKTGLFTRARAIVHQPVRALRLVFKTADIILGSLSFMPGVEPIIEFKESLDAGLDLAEVMHLQSAAEAEAPGAEGEGPQQPAEYPENKVSRPKPGKYKF